MISCNSSDLLNALTFVRPSASDFNTSLGTWRTLMFEKACLIPVLNVTKIKKKYSVLFCSFKDAGLGKSRIKYYYNSIT